jgi:oligopeptide transport system ATP-binding protein
VMSDNLLEVRDLRKSFRFPNAGKNKLCALDGITLDLKRGETLGLVGESGCGKSTLARPLLMLDRPDSGTVRFDGIDPFGLRGKDLLAFRRRVQMVFQDPYASLNARMSAGDIIAEPWRSHKGLYTTRATATCACAGCWIWSASVPRRRTSTRRSSPAASASASASPARSRSTPT